MRRAVRAVVIKDNKLLVMRRNKFGQQYYCLIGGGVDVGESLEHALLREVMEESSIVATNPRFIILEHAGDPFGDQYIFLCTYKSGEPALSPESIEAAIHKMGQNLYEPMWLPLEQLGDSPFVSETLKQALLNMVEDGFAGQPKTIVSNAEIRYTTRETRERRETNHGT